MVPRPAKPPVSELNSPLRDSRHQRVIFIPILVATAAIWAVTIWLTITERQIARDRIADELRNTIVTLADFNELAEASTGEGIVRASERRTETMWRALLQHPSATIWVESDSDRNSGQPPDPESLANAITVSEEREAFTVHAAIPGSEALAEWRQNAAVRTLTLTGATAAFLLLSHILLRSMRQKAAAQDEAETAKARESQLAAYKAELEETVALRTTELANTNSQLSKELAERQAAEAELQEHDALLHAVSKSAAELLGSHSHDDALATVLALIGQTIGVGRVHIRSFATSSDGHLHVSIRHEWCAPGLDPLIDHPLLATVDLSSEIPRCAAALVAGEPASFDLHDIATDRRSLMDNHGFRSVLQVPIRLDDKIWGSIDFGNATLEPREWSWAETDTLETLAELIGAAMTRARYVKELADANMIVQNSPTILYRVRGEPPFPLIYVSHNITKYGHDPDALTNRPDWTALLMDENDESRLRDAMARSLERDTSGATIEFRLRTGDGSSRWVENRYTPVRDKEHRLVEIEGMIIDITERKIAEEKIAHLARTDALTGLANRATFIDRLRQAFSASQRGAAPFAILYLDLDHFKPINDTLGHPVGDKLLCAVADRLRECTRDNDLVSRLGGDEFAILQMDMTEPAAAGALASKLQSALMRTFSVDSNDLHITVSIGICPYDDTSASPDSMLTQADLALYRSKEEGRNRYRFHTDDLDQQVNERVSLSDDLRRAISNGELELYYQPQIELRTDRIVGMEAFVRWRHPKRGLLAASAFVPVAEKTGSIIPLGQWVLDNACGQMRRWHDDGVNPPVITMNLSLPQLKNSAELIRDVREAIEKWNLKPSDLNFDVTEAMLAQITLMRNDVLTELRRIGVGISIDDFGSQYSSLNYLRTYRVNHLKITSEFMDGIDENPERARTVRAIINFARELDIGVITEGVETEEQLDASSSTSIIAQGFYFSEALEPGRAGELLRDGAINRRRKARSSGQKDPPPTPGKPHPQLPSSRQRAK